MAAYVTRFELAKSGTIPAEQVPIELAMAKAREPRVKLLALWFTSGYRDLVAVWDAASEQIVHAIVAEVTDLCGISAETVFVFSDEELTHQWTVIPDIQIAAGESLRAGASDTSETRDPARSP